MSNSSPRSLATFAAGHLLHLIIVLLPTFLLSGIAIGQAPVLLFAVLVLAAGLIESLLVKSSQRESEHDPLALQVAALVGLTILLMFWGAQLERWLIERNAWPLTIWGAGLTTAGILLRASAIHALGPRFVSDICCDAPPVSLGIYRYMRHPSEVGLLAIAVGGPLILQAPWSALIAGSVLLPISVWRIRREDKVLAQATRLTQQSLQSFQPCKLHRQTDGKRGIATAAFLGCFQMMSLARSEMSETIITHGQ